MFRSILLIGWYWPRCNVAPLHGSPLLPLLRSMLPGPLQTDVFTCILGVLLVGFIPIWVTRLTHYTVNIQAVADCKLLLPLTVFFLYYSSAILVIMSIEKFIALYFPFKSKSICTLKTAKRVTFCTTVIYLAFCSQYIYFYKSRKVSDDLPYVCLEENIPESYKELFYQLDSILYTYVPFLIMGVFNLAIIVKFVQAKRGNKHDGPESTSQALSRNASRGVAMVVTVSIMFIVLTGPASIMQSAGLLKGNVMGVFTVSVISYSNHAINGVLYCVVGSRFRAEIINTLCCRNKRRSMKKSSHVLSTTNVGEKVTNST